MKKMIKKLTVVFILMTVFIPGIVLGEISGESSDPVYRKKSHRSWGPKKYKRKWKQRKQRQVKQRYSKVGERSEVAQNTEKTGTLSEEGRDDDAPVKASETKPETDEPVEVVRRAEREISADVRSGNVSVLMAANANAVVKIGLSPRGVTLIEFPADDPIYEIHSGSEDLVKISCRKREGGESAFGRCLDDPNTGIVLRPGENFHNQVDGGAASTVVTVQRASGIVVTFVIFAVKRVEQNANYVSVRYRLGDVLEARRNAGLAVFLDKFKPADEKQARPEPNKKEGDGGGVQKDVTAKPADAVLDVSALRIDATGDDLETALRNSLLATKGETPRLQFEKPVNGLALAPGKSLRFSGDLSIQVVAVRNVYSEDIRLVPEQPDVLVEAYGEGKVASMLSKVEVVEVSTTAPEGDVLRPGVVYYYAFAYKSPILGVKERVKVSFAQREAADQPVKLMLAKISR